MANVCHAVRLAAGPNGPETAILACGREGAADGVVLLNGDPGDLGSFDPAALDAALAPAAAVHVHQCLTPFGLFMAARARMQGKKVVGTDHGGGEAASLAAQSHLARLFHAVMSYSTLGKVAASDLAVMHWSLRGPVDDAAFTLEPDDRRDRFHVVALGRVLPHKGLDALISAMPEGLQLTIAGRSYDPDYREALNRLALGRAVRFEEGLDDDGVRRLLAAAGLCVQFSVHRDLAGRHITKPELLGLAPLEAMCTGLPTIVSRAGALPELGVLSGCRVAHDAAELSDLLHAHAAGLRWPGGAAIRADAVAAYGLAQFGRAYLSCITELLSCGC